MTPLELIVRYAGEQTTASGDTADFPIDSLNERGADLVDHALGSFADHLLRTAKLLQSWGASREVCLAGLFHSAYGSPYVPICLFDEHERDQVRMVIGPEAEHLAFAYSVLDREVIRQPQGRVNACAPLPGIGPRELEKLLQIDFANELDQAMGDDSGPGLWICRWSAIAKEFPSIQLPIFEALRQITISLAQEIDARAAYAEALRARLPLRSSAFDRLCAASTVLGLPGEPLLVAAAHLHVRGAVDESKAAALEADRRMRTLSSPWDKRTSSDSWLAWATAMMGIPELITRGSCT